MIKTIFIKRKFVTNFVGVMIKTIFIKRKFITNFVGVMIKTIFIKNVLASEKNFCFFSISHRSLETHILK